MRKENMTLQAELEELKKVQAREREELERLRTSEQQARREAEAAHAETTKQAEEIRVLELTKSHIERTLEEDRRRHQSAVEMLQATVANAEAEQKHQLEEQKRMSKRLEDQLEQRDARWRAEVQRLWMEVTGNPAPKVPTI